jgi:putative SOS response-associated peptidase YedK
VKRDGPNVEIEVYSFLTTVPNSATASINHERSPVILTTDKERDIWLGNDADAARALIRPLDGDRLRIVQAGTEKRDLMQECAAKDWRGQDLAR